MEVIKVNASRSYEIKIGRGLLSCVGEELSHIGKSGTAVVVSDDRVFQLYGETVIKSLEKQGFCTLHFTFPEGEASKTPETLVRLWRFLAENGVTRSDTLLALGGGVTGDITGFAAATYLRGIAVVQLPTSLLAMVDSSVGGKTAVDLPEGKNLVGAFYQPSLVLCDPDALKTLPDAVFSDGMAEVIKYGLLGNKPLFERLFTMDRERDIADVIRLSVEDKRNIVERDERDTATRQLLNLGHTLGHAVERVSGYTVTHGAAVSVGMVAVTRAAVKRGYCSPEVLSSLIELLSLYGLPTQTGYSPSALAEAATRDKKRTGGVITLVLPYGIGDARLCRLQLSELLALFAEGLSE